jgi:hypothetical protein
VILLLETTWCASPSFRWDIAKARRDKGTDLSGSDLSGRDLSGRDLSGVAHARKLLGRVLLLRNREMERVTLLGPNLRGNDGWELEKSFITSRLDCLYE